MKIKIDFADFWTHFNKKHNYFTELLSKHFDIEFSDQPDFLIYSCYGQNHLNYYCYKIFYNGENLRVNWNSCDYAFSFDYLDDERHFRLPNWIWYQNPALLLQEKPPLNKLLETKIGFCNMVVSNPLAKKRIEFFHKLSQYKRVDSGGRYLNNIGGPVVDKLKFIRNYKFTIAFENSSFPGYTTEKIFEPMLSGSIPIYWGNTEVGRDFNTSSFLNWHQFGSDEKLIDYIIKLDSDDTLYGQLWEEPWFKNNKLPDCVNEERIILMFDKIFSQATKTKPVAQQQIRKFYYNLDLLYKRIDGYFDRHLNYRNKFR